MGRFSRRIVVELTERDYHRLLKAGERHRRSPQHQAGVFIEDALNADEVWPQSVTGPQTATATDLRLPMQSPLKPPPETDEDAAPDHVERFPIMGDPYAALDAAATPTAEPPSGTPEAVSAAIHMQKKQDATEASVWPTFRNEPSKAEPPQAEPEWGVDVATADTPPSAETPDTNPPDGVSGEAPKRKTRARS